MVCIECSAAWTNDQLTQEDMEINPGVLPTEMFWNRPLLPAEVAAIFEGSAACERHHFFRRTCPRAGRAWYDFHPNEGGKRLRDRPGTPLRRTWNVRSGM